MNLDCFLIQCQRKVLLKMERKVEKENQVKNDAPSHCLWLLMTLRFVALVRYGDPKTLHDLETYEAFLTRMESVISQTLKLG